MKILILLVALSQMSWAQVVDTPPPEWPVELIKVEKPDYPRNHKASFCYRPPEIVDTIVLHHTETPATATALDINEMHLARSSGTDLWYMIAYSYVINSPYAGASKPIPLVSEGRPLDIVGAHAGSGVFLEMDPEQQKAWDDGKIVCGTEGGEFKVDPSQINGNKIKANVTTIGLVIIGNYVKFSRDNPGGYPPGKVRNPTDGTQDMIAKMSCQLQKKYPKMKKIRWHKFYHSTDCPGTIENFVDQIRVLAKGYGCEFN